jgi:hypothetical protein
MIKSKKYNKRNSKRTRNNSDKRSKRTRKQTGGFTRISNRRIETQARREAAAQLTFDIKNPGYYVPLRLKPSLPGRVLSAPGRPTRSFGRR